MVYLFTGLISDGDMGNKRVAMNSFEDVVKFSIWPELTLEGIRERVSSSLKITKHFTMLNPENNLHPIKQIERVRQLSEIQKEFPDVTFIVTTVSNYIIEAFELYFKDNIKFYLVEDGKAEEVDIAEIDILYKPFAQTVQKLEELRITV